MRCLALLSAAVLLLAACGGGGGSGGAPTALVIPSDAAKSGSVAYDGTSSRLQATSTADVVYGGLVPRPPSGPIPPLIPPWDAVRGIYACPLTGVPAGARIVEARLEVAQVGVLAGTYTALASGEVAGFHDNADTMSTGLQPPVLVVRYE